jgi:dihydroxyacetone kinase
MTARDTLVTSLTNLFARTRNGRLDAHRAEAERLVDEAMTETAFTLSETIADDSWSRYQREEYEAGMRRAAELIQPEVTS